MHTSLPPSAPVHPSPSRRADLIAMLRSILRSVRADRGLGSDLWDAQVGRDVEAITRIIALTAVAAYTFAELQATMWEGRTDPFWQHRVGLIAVVVSSFFWMPRALQRWRSPLPAALFWGAVPLTSAALDRASGGLLVDVLWSLIPGYLAIGVVGFSFGSAGLAAWLAGYCACVAALVYDLPRGMELQFAFLLMMLATGGYLTHLYRRSVRTQVEVTRLQHERVRNLARVLPEPIAAAVHDEAQLRELMRPREREVVAVRIDVRRSTHLLKQIAAIGYATVVRPLTAELYRHAHSLNAFAKFEGDGLLVVFDAFTDQPVGEDTAMRVIDFVHHADHTAGLITESLRKRGLPPLHIGMGVDRGVVIAGTVAGMHDELLFDVIGEAINRASRLESWTKVLLKRQPEPRNIAVLSASVAALVPDGAGLERVELNGEIRDFETVDHAFQLLLGSGYKPLHWDRAAIRISGGFDDALLSGGWSPPDVGTD